MQLLRDGGTRSGREVLQRAARFSEFAEKFLAVDQAREFYRNLPAGPDGSGPQALLDAMQVKLKTCDADVDRIPQKGAVVAVANHPFGLLDGAALVTLLGRVRPDVRVLTNALLDDVPELAQRCIFVDPFGEDRLVNVRALRDASAWLSQGGMLAVFPSGEVSHLDWKRRLVADPEWSATAARLARRNNAAALPIYFCGRNSVPFQLLGMIHPRLRTAALLHEFLRQKGKMVEIRIGSPVSADELKELPGSSQATEYLRSRTYLLAQRKSLNKPKLPAWVTVQLPPPARVAKAMMPELLHEGVSALPAERCLLRNGGMAVHLLKGAESPVLMHEIGRLRETTFRGVGEGSGRKLDLDRFDDYYWHLLLWDEQKRAVVGAYRAGVTDDIVREKGISGLYTSTLFRYAPELFERIGPALELGRSFIRPEYQKQYSPLLLLWKAIAALVARYPEMPVLFGAVSISNAYNRVSREMIYRYFEARRSQDELAPLVRPRRPFRASPLGRWDSRGVVGALRDLEDLSSPISDVESDGKGLPVLLRQYAKVGGRLLGFNVDRKFSNVLDGLVLVDMRKTEASVLEKYMGRAGAARFRQHHGIVETAAAKA